MTRVIGRILLTVAALAVTGFMLLVLIGLWDRYEQQTAALGFSGIYERYLGWQAGPSVDPKGRAAAKAERARSFEQRPKLVGTGAVGSSNQGMSVALSADGNTAIVGGPGPNNADRDRSPVVGPAGAAWVFTRSGGTWTQQGGKLVGTTSEYGGDCGPKVHPSPFLPTATPPSLAGLATIEQLGRRGSSPAAAVFGRSKAISWSAAERVNRHCRRAKECQSRFPPTATLPSWVAGGQRERGCSRAAAVPGRSKA